MPALRPMLRRLLAAAGLSLCVATGWAQETPPDSAAVAAGSVAPDSLYSSQEKVPLAGSALTEPAHRQKRPAEPRTPRGALRRAALVPGWGQIYNRQTIKLPLVYGGIGAFVFSAVRNNRDYALYGDAYLYKAYEELVQSGQLSENPYASRSDAYDQLAADLGPVSAGPLRTRRDAYRRNRDLSFLGVGLIWGLAVIDAYVSAHMADFDVGEDLSLGVEPAWLNAPGGASAGLRLRLKFSSGRGVTSRP